MSRIITACIDAVKALAAQDAYTTDSWTLPDSVTMEQLVWKMQSMMSEVPQLENRSDLHRSKLNICDDKVQAPMCRDNCSSVEKKKRKKESNPLPPPNTKQTTTKQQLQNILLVAATNICGCKRASKLEATIGDKILYSETK